MRTTRVWRRVLGVEHTVIESVDLETDARGQEVLLARARVKAGAARRCSRCQRRCPGYDTSPDPRRWRGWTISAIARHLGRDRKTVRAYLSGKRTPGVRRRSTPSSGRHVLRQAGRDILSRPASSLRGRGSLARIAEHRLLCFWPSPRPPNPQKRAQIAVNPARVLSVSRSARARTHDAATAPDHHPGRAAAWLHATWTTKTRSPPAQPRRTLPKAASPTTRSDGPPPRRGVTAAALTRQMTHGCTRTRPWTTWLRRSMSCWWATPTTWRPPSKPSIPHSRRVKPPRRTTLLPCCALRSTTGPSGARRHGGPVQLARGGAGPAKC